MYFNVFKDVDGFKNFECDVQKASLSDMPKNLWFFEQMHTL